MKLSVIVTRPKSVIDVKKLTAAAEAQLDVSAKEASDLLAKPTSTWNHKPKMRTVRGRLWRAAGTNDRIYRFVSQGTRKHTIRGKNGRLLAFGPSRPKTRPGSLNARGGSRKKASTFVNQVNHPGTKPRRFDDAAAKKLQRGLKKQMQDAITKALQ